MKEVEIAVMCATWHFVVSQLCWDETVVHRSSRMLTCRVSGSWDILVKIMIKLCFRAGLKCPLPGTLSVLLTGPECWEEQYQNVCHLIWSILHYLKPVKTSVHSETLLSWGGPQMRTFVIFTMATSFSAGILWNGWTYTLEWR